MRQLAPAGEALVEPDDCLVAVTDRGRHVQETWSLFAGQREHVVVESLRLLRGIPTASEPDNVLLRHRKQVYDAL